MIYTVTFNPAMDYVVYLEEMVPGRLHRAVSERIYAGGKGINVSLVLARLGVRSRALGFVAGFTGRAIEERLREQGVETDLIRLEEGCSRINVKIRAAEETELNGQGPRIPERAVTELLEKLDRLERGDTLVLAGSIPGTLSEDMYERILARLAGRGIRTVVDAAGALLRNVLKYRPFLIKPNRQELGELFGADLKTEKEILSCAERLRKLGAVNVLVSMAGEGAILVDEQGFIRRQAAYTGQVRNSVGAGDSMVAGFLAGLERGDSEYALRLGAAAGAATAFSDGLATGEAILNLMREPADGN